MSACRHGRVDQLRRTYSPSLPGKKRGIGRTCQSPWWRADGLARKPLFLPLPMDHSEAWRNLRLVGTRTRRTASRKAWWWYGVDDNGRQRRPEIRGYKLTQRDGVCRTRRLEARGSKYGVHDDCYLFWRGRRRPPPPPSSPRPSFSRSASLSLLLRCCLFLSASLESRAQARLYVAGLTG